MFYIGTEPDNLYLINLLMDIGLLIENVACFPVTHEISHNREDVGFLSMFHLSDTVSITTSSGRTDITSLLRNRTNARCLVNSGTRNTSRLSSYS